MLTAAFAELAAAPMIATACDHIRPGYRRYNVGRHMIYFRVTSRVIVLIRILHERMEACALCDFLFLHFLAYSVSSLRVLTTCQTVKIKFGNPRP